MMSQSQPDQIKIIIVGKAGVGKTALMERYVSRKFGYSYKSNIGADFYTKRIKIDDISVTMQIWDTAGQERFQSLGNYYYRAADGAILVYDITNKESFIEIEEWRKNVLIHAAPKNQELFPFILLGNKLDLLNRGKSRFDEYGNNDKMILLVISGFCRDIEQKLKKKYIPIEILNVLKRFCGTINVAILYSHKHNIPFYETSAKDNINVSEPFIEIAKKCLNRNKQDKSLLTSNATNLDPGSNLTTYGCCY